MREQDKLLFLVVEKSNVFLRENFHDRRKVQYIFTYLYIYVY